LKSIFQMLYSIGYKYIIIKKINMFFYCVHCCSILYTYIMEKFPDVALKYRLGKNQVYFLVEGTIRFRNDVSYIYIMIHNINVLLLS